MPPTEEAVFASMKTQAETQDERWARMMREDSKFMESVAVLQARDERIRRAAKNEAYEEAAKRADKHAIHAKSPEVMLALEGVASAIRSMKVEVPRE